MPIYPLVYRHWDGERTGAWARCRAITRAGVATLWRSRFRKVVVVFAPMPVLFYLGLAYFFAEYVFGTDESLVNQFVNVIGQGASDLVRGDSSARASFWTLLIYGYLCNPASFLTLFVVAVTGTGLVAADRRHNAHEIYFARPVRWRDYLLGKLGVIGFYVGVVMLLPALLLFLEIVLLSPKAADVWFLLDLAPRLVLVWAMWTVFAGLPVLAISSLSASTGLAGFLWAVLWIGSDMVSGIAHRVYVAWKWPVEAMHPGRFRPPPEWMIPSWAEGLSFGDNLISLHYRILGGPDAAAHFLEMPVLGDALKRRIPGVSPWVSLALVGGLAVISLLILRWRIRPEGAV